MELLVDHKTVDLVPLAPNLLNYLCVPDDPKYLIVLLNHIPSVPQLLSKYINPLSYVLAR